MTEKYRKKPVEVEVIKFDRDKWNEEESQEKASETFPMVVASIGSGFKTIPVIETLEGDMKVSDGDYIIKGVQGEFYPCKPDIFHETYEPVSNHQPTFEVGEYYSSDNGKKVFKIFGNADDQIEYCVYDTQYSTLKNWLIPEKDIVAIFPDSKPATAEQIATFKRAEHFAAHGRKLDEFHVGDKVSVVGADEIVKIDSLRGDSSFGGVSDLGNYFIISTPSYYGVTLIQTAEELREVEKDG